MNSSRRGTMKAGITVFCALSLLAPACARPEERIQITFDGPPEQPPGPGKIVTSYTESNMSFRPILRSRGFSRYGSGDTGGGPDNGTAYVSAALGESLMFDFSNGPVFDLVSIDVAEYSTFYQTPLRVRFVGYHPDGSTVTTNFTTDGVIDGTGPLADFENFYFDQEWTNLARVEIPSYGWSLDNLVVSI